MYQKHISGAAAAVKSIAGPTSLTELCLCDVWGENSVVNDHETSHEQKLLCLINVYFLLISPVNMYFSMRFLLMGISVRGIIVCKLTSISAFVRSGL